MAMATIPAGGTEAASDAPAEASAAPKLEFAFEVLATLAPRVAVGATPFGERTLIPITGGTVNGPDINGVVVPGGWDWQLRRADGCLDVKADYMLRTDDGVVINVLNKGVICPAKAGAPARPVRTQPVFEAPLGKYEWMGQSAFIGTLEIAKAADGGPAVRLRFYRVT